MYPLKVARLILMIVVSLTLLGPEGLALKKKEPLTKMIRGQVVDKDNQPVSGAKVFVRIALKDKTTILVSDEAGLFSIYGLDPQLDYIVHAESRNLRSEKKTISHYLDRKDNFLALELVASIQASSGNSPPVKERFEVELGGESAFKLMGDWYEPQGAKEKSPAVLLVHGFGENRHTWDPFIQSYLLPKGFGVLSLDLRGHGGSTLKGSETVQAQPNWTSEPNQFPVDIAVAVSWLKSKQGIDANRIACIGGGMGADLAYFASGKFEEVRTAVALSPTAETALNWVKGIQNFQPHSILFVAAEGDSPAIDSSHQLETLTGFPVQVRIILNSNLKGSKLVRDTPAVAQMVIEWIQKNI
jgi:pimeloyl-ACP methyl ester carboxylesterase